MVVAGGLLPDPWWIWDCSSSAARLLHKAPRSQLLKKKVASLSPWPAMVAREVGLEADYGVFL
jgi:hypothetical protein